MSVWLRIILIFMAIVSNTYVLRKIRKSQMKIDGAIYWIFFGAVILLLSIFPNVCYMLADLIGVESPANLVFLVVIFIVLGKLFTQSVKISQIEYKISILTEEIAIWRKQVEDENMKINNGRDGTEC